MLAAGAVQGEDAFTTFNPRNLPRGSIVRVAARRPPVNAAHAEVVECTTNLLTLRLKRDRFSIAPTNILELTLLAKPEDAPAPEPEAQSGEDSGKLIRQVAPTEKGLWERIKAFWESIRAGKTSPKASPSRGFGPGSVPGAKPGGA